jgi:hypothetical protein
MSRLPGMIEGLARAVSFWIRVVPEMNWLGFSGTIAVICLCANRADALPSFDGSFLCNEAAYALVAA